METTSSFWEDSSIEAGARLKSFLQRNPAPWLLNFFVSDDGLTALQKNYGLMAFIVQDFENRQERFIFTNADNGLMISIEAGAVACSRLQRGEGSELFTADYLAAMLPQELAPMGHQPYHPWTITLEAITE